MATVVQTLDQQKARKAKYKKEKAEAKAAKAKATEATQPEPEAPKEPEKPKLVKPEVARGPLDTYRVTDTQSQKAVESNFASRSDARVLRNYYNALHNTNRFVISRGKDHKLGATVGHSVG